MTTAKPLRVGMVGYAFMGAPHSHAWRTAAESPDAGFRRIFVTEPEHPYVGNWWPTGHGLGYEHGFTHQVVDLVTAIGEGCQPQPSFADALQVQQVLAAVESSAANASQWQTV